VNPAAQNRSIDFGAPRTLATCLTPGPIWARCLGLRDKPLGAYGPLGRLASYDARLAPGIGARHPIDLGVPMWGTWSRGGPTTGDVDDGAHYGQRERGWEAPASGEGGRP
jgi:hypothetical protein